MQPTSGLRRPYQGVWRNYGAPGTDATEAWGFSTDGLMSISLRASIHAASRKDGLGKHFTSKGGRWLGIHITGRLSLLKSLSRLRDYYGMPNSSLLWFNRWAYSILPAYMQTMAIVSGESVRRSDCHGCDNHTLVFVILFELVPSQSAVAEKRESAKEQFLPPSFAFAGNLNLQSSRVVRLITRILT